LSLRVLSDRTVTAAFAKASKLFLLPVPFEHSHGNSWIESHLTPEQAFDDHHRAVYRFVYRLVGRADLAEDITQDCFLAILSQPERWNPDRGDMKTYLFSIARNLAFKRYRDDHTKAQVDDDQAASIADHRIDQELSAVIAQMVSQLPDRQREALILFEYEGFQLSEISQIVKADTGVVKSRLYRARERLKRLLAPYRKVGTYGAV
jgi:RNA polymerase sigma-70 factor (ECF subfamily)